MIEIGDESPSHEEEVQAQLVAGWCMMVQRRTSEMTVKDVVDQVLNMKLEKTTRTALDFVGGLRSWLSERPSAELQLPCGRGSLLVCGKIFVYLGFEN